MLEEITLTISYQNAVVGIELEDNSRQLPIPRKGSISALDGRGLCLVAAEADAWTSRLNPDGTGKRVLAFLRWPSTPCGRLTATRPHHSTRPIRSWSCLSCPHIHRLPCCPS